MRGRSQPEHHGIDCEHSTHGGLESSSGFECSMLRLNGDFDLAGWLAQIAGHVPRADVPLPRLAVHIPSALGLCCGGLWAAMVLATLFMGSAPASADGSEERSAGATGSLSLGGLGALKAACREAREPGRRRLYVVELGRYHFDVADREEGFLPLDTTHNLSAFGGAAALFPSDMETIGFHASERRRRALRNARRAGARLRVGFFLGFDGEGQPCVIRPSVGVTTVRMDVAFLELVDERGRVIARDDTERLRAWSDDLQHEVVAGAGPRVGIDAPWSEQGSIAPTILHALHSQAAAMGQCHAQGVARGSAREGRVLLRIAVRSGRTVRPSIAFSTLRDERTEACLARAADGVAVSSPDADITLPLRLVTD